MGLQAGPDVADLQASFSPSSASTSEAKREDFVPLGLQFHPLEPTVMPAVQHTLGLTAGLM